jgi:hypothetical protein
MMVGVGYYKVITASSSAGGANDILIQDLVTIKKTMFDI